MTAAILGIGTAVPPGTASQRDALAFALQTIGDDQIAARTLPALYRRSGVESRGSVLAEGPGGAQSFFAPAAHPEDRGPGTGQRITRYAREAPRLAARASATALENARVEASRITHLVTVSCTGFDAPGIDIRLVEMLGLSPEVQRTHIGYMGCHGAINALRVASAIAAQDPCAVVLVCATEICSVHYQYGSDPEQIVSNALFADGAAAAVIGAGTGPRLRGFGSMITPCSTDAMQWRIGDHGFEMTLSARVPELISTSVRSWLTTWLSRHGLELGQIGSWCVHPGGPRILSAVAEGLALESGALATSREVLAQHGNMSSPTVLFILDRLQRAGRIDPERPCIMLGFGPGLVTEAAIIG
jgi:predicted naringenin-chalcone synthase